MAEKKELQWSDIPNGERIKFVIGKVLSGDLSLKSASISVKYKTALSILIISEDYLCKHPFEEKEFIVRALVKQKNNHHIAISFVMAFHDLLKHTFTINVSKDMLAGALEYTPIVGIEEYKSHLESSLHGKMIDLQNKEKKNRADFMDFVRKQSQRLEEDKVLTQSQKMEENRVGRQERFIQQAKEKFGDEYDYSRVDYTDAKTGVLIGCPDHGYSSVIPSTFLINGCPECAREKKYREDFLKKARRIHGSKYDYPRLPVAPGNIIYIRCKEHGLFPQRADLHLMGHGCPYCATGGRLPIEERQWNFIQKSKQRYGNRFDYSQVIYYDKKTPVQIRCREHNYSFFVLPDTHVRRYSGCPICNESLGEIEVRKWLDGMKVKYESQYNIPNENPKCRRSCLRVDFWLPEHNMIVEFHGEQHYEDIPYFYDSKEWTFKDQQIRDQTLRDYCKKTGIRLVEICYKDIDKIPSILKKAVSSIP